MAFNRDDLIRGLRQLVATLRERGEPAGIRIIGGAALSLRYFDRRTTEDIDAKLHPPAAALAAAAEIANANGWPADWLNTKADHFIPIAKDVGWEPLYDDDEGLPIRAPSRRLGGHHQPSCSRPQGSSPEIFGRRSQHPGAPAARRGGGP